MAGTSARRRLGDRGEQLAAAWYLGHGYEILDRNWRCAVGEIDLVLRKGATVVICEVKTRSSLAYGSPGEAVTGRKRTRLRRLAARWLVTHSVHAHTVRFDVAAVLGDHLEILESVW
ncbi:MAG TPA: YraN family protein [Acidimicrobiales bacterium]|nr:YraN family protein [Acidimicrobiales bacterium]